MDRSALFITRQLPQPVMAAIPPHYRLVAEPTDHPLTQDALRRGLAQADAVICTLTDRIDDSIISEAKQLKIIANYAVGYNNIDLAAAISHGIVVTNTPDVLTDATADLTWALIFALSRRVVEGDSWVRTGTWSGWAPTQMLGAEVSGKTLGIIGMGRIGQAVAQRAVGFRMPVIYAAHRPISAPSGMTWTHRSLDDVLQESDFLSLHVPLTNTTHHLIGRDQLAQMKRTAFLINTSRGTVIDEAALVVALEGNRIAGAGLDVYEDEPRVSAGLIALPNVVLLPHIGSATLETRVHMGLMCLENIVAVLEGRPALSRVV